ncbi:TetR/AcrR family transcriptional regulator [bacterium]|nr:TetR/AcrR family transcriptional regulator [bacterium]
MTRKKQSSKRTAILEATLELIAVQGFHQTPTAQIAELANVGVGTIYRYFTDKDELIRKLFEYVIRQENDEALKNYNPTAPLRERFLQLCSGMIQFAVRHPKHANFLEQYFHSPYGLNHRRQEVLNRTHRDTTQPPLIELFDQAKAQQVVKDFPESILAALTLGPILELIRDINAGLMEYDPELINRFIEACWDALKR